MRLNEPNLKADNCRDVQDMQSLDRKLFRFPGPPLQLDSRQVSMARLVEQQSSEQRAE